MRMYSCRERESFVCRQEMRGRRHRRGSAEAHFVWRDEDLVLLAPQAKECDVVLRVELADGCARLGREEGEEPCVLHCLGVVKPARLGLGSGG